jgi:hypothetical protein
MAHEYRTIPEYLTGLIRMDASNHFNHDQVTEWALLPPGERDKIDSQLYKKVLADQFDRAAKKRRRKKQTQKQPNQPKT